MALATYSDLTTSIGNWLNRTDLASIIPDFVSLAEARIARDLRLRRQVTNTTLSTTGGVQYVTLPSDYLEAENLTLTNTSPPAALSVVTPEILDRRYPNNYSTSQPQVYAIVGTQLQLGPTPDGVYTLSLDYYQRFTALATSPTNWLLTNHPNIYLAASLAEAYLYLADEQRATLWAAKYDNEAGKLQERDDTALRSGSAMRVRTL